MNTVYLILGGNKGNKLDYLQSAIQLIEEQVGSIKEKSAIFQTSPWGNTNQPDFINQIILVLTSFSATELLKQLLQIEEKSGRIRDHQKWQQRTMDIDILLFNNDIINTSELKIPHPFIQDRKFVLVPLAQLAPEIIHPVLNKSIETLLAECKDDSDVRQLKLEI